MIFVHKYKIGIKIFAVLSTLLFAACVEGKSVLLEYKDIQFFEIKEIHSPSNTSLKISGLVFHSAMGVEKIETKVDSKSIYILIYIAPAGNKLSGNFEYIVDIPENIETIYFGPTKRLLWKRGSGIVNE